NRLINRKLDDMSLAYRRIKIKSSIAFTAGEAILAKKAVAPLRRLSPNPFNLMQHTVGLPMTFNEVLVSPQQVLHVSTRLNDAVGRGQVVTHLRKRFNIHLFRKHFNFSHHYSPRSRTCGMEREMKG
ncbi:MAG: hypothetical protein KF746_28260, partial [Chitinophagaceae bacterium]|nr:hypothetical protein [Chitinophagaceae bacterium]